MTRSNVRLISFLSFSDMPMASTTSSHDQLAPQQLLDVLLEDASLQHHLADLINSSLLRYYTYVMPGYIMTIIIHVQ